MRQLVLSTLIILCCVGSAVACHDCDHYYVDRAIYYCPPGPPPGPPPPPAYYAPPPPPPYGYGGPHYVDHYGPSGFNFAVGYSSGHGHGHGHGRGHGGHHGGGHGYSFSIGGFGIGR